MKTSAISFPHTNRNAWQSIAKFSIAIHITTTRTRSRSHKMGNGRPRARQRKNGDACKKQESISKPYNIKNANVRKLVFFFSPFKILLVFHFRDFYMFVHFSWLHVYVCAETYILATRYIVFTHSLTHSVYFLVQFHFLSHSSSLFGFWSLWWLFYTDVPQKLASNNTHTYTSLPIACLGLVFLIYEEHFIYLYCTIKIINKKKYTRKQQSTTQHTFTICAHINFPCFHYFWEDFIFAHYKRIPYTLHNMYRKFYTSRNGWVWAADNKNEAKMSVTENEPKRIERQRARERMHFIWFFLLS